MINKLGNTKAISFLIFFFNVTGLYAQDTTALHVLENEHLINKIVMKIKSNKNLELVKINGEDSLLQDFSCNFFLEPLTGKVSFFNCIYFSANKEFNFYYKNNNELIFVETEQQKFYFITNKLYDEKGNLQSGNDREKLLQLDLKLKNILLLLHKPIK